MRTAPTRKKVDAIERMLQLMEIEHLRKAHPYDLSGGGAAASGAGQDSAA